MKKNDSFSLASAETGIFYCDRSKLMRDADYARLAAVSNLEVNTTL